MLRSEPKAPASAHTAQGRARIEPTEASIFAQITASRDRTIKYAASRCLSHANTDDVYRYGASLPRFMSFSRHATL